MEAGCAEQKVPGPLESRAKEPERTFFLMFIPHRNQEPASGTSGQLPEPCSSDGSFWKFLQWFLLKLPAVVYLFRRPVPGTLNQLSWNSWGQTSRTSSNI